MKNKEQINSSKNEMYRYNKASLIVLHYLIHHSKWAELSYLLINIEATLYFLTWKRCRWSKWKILFCPSFLQEYSHVNTIKKNVFYNLFLFFFFSFSLAKYNLKIGNWTSSKNITHKQRVKQIYIINPKNSTIYKSTVTTTSQNIT